MWILLLLITLSCFQHTVFGSENKLKMELSIEESLSLKEVYRKEPWETIKEYHKDNAISFNVKMCMPGGERPLSVAIRGNRMDIAYTLLDKENVNVDYVSSDALLNPLHELAMRWPASEKGSNDRLFLVNEYKAVFEKLVSKGCNVNAISKGLKTPLAILLELENGSSGSAIFIKNGALLRVKDEKRCWNGFDEIFYSLRSYAHENLYRISCIRHTISSLDEEIKHLVLSKCIYDYTSYCKLFFTLSLVCNRFKGEKKYNTSNLLVDSMVLFLPSPVDHIEEALIDAWGKQPLDLETKKTKYFSENDYKVLLDYVMPGSLRNAWKAYQNGERDESNLIVLAFNYEGSK